MYGNIEKAQVNVFLRMNLQNARNPYDSLDPILTGHHDLPRPLGFGPEGFISSLSLPPELWDVSDVDIGTREGVP